MEIWKKSGRIRFKVKLNKTMKKYRKLDNAGAVSPLLLGLVAVILMFIIALFYGLNQKSKVSDYELNLGKKVATEVEAQKKLISDQKQAEFDEREKAPYKFWTSPTQYGSIKVGFPKTWSYYLSLSDVGGGGDKEVDLYAHPDYVPGLASESKYALRLTLESTDYNQALEQYRRDSEEKKLSISTIQNSNVSGVKIRGSIGDEVNGTMVIFPIRDKVLSVWTESPDYEADFENIVLKNLSFIP